MTNFIPQGKTIGIIGGGQLGQMMALDAKQTGMKVIILDPTPACPAGQVADEQIVAPYASIKAIEELADKADVLTYEFENVDLKALEDVANRAYIPQGTRLLYITKNRLREKTFLRKAGLKTAPFLPVHDDVSLRKAIKMLGYPAVLKTSEGGYDGHGQEVLRNDADLPKCSDVIASGGCILEGWVPFKLECSVMVGRNEKGDTTVFPVAENIHHNEILHLSIIPARISTTLQQAAQRMALKIAEAMNLRGVLGVEMFVTDSGEIYVNELAPRPHNSGHYSIEACNFSQFAIHNRAISNWPLPKIELLKPAVMVNVLGQHVAGVRAVIKDKADWHFHDYGKAAIRHNRKMGHVTILTDDITRTLSEIDNTGIWIN
ncbi:5-(carboxyamino)imidazole ribonucleotide synthase [Lactobacillus sp. 0.1XD8-4]|uniref:5-(carboxyamino)imidazole ribonucleotide synthase n=1 Tax=uncultured Limosilactobacillus sp. TaxID=2837629 RepID=UPI00129D92FF|nr:5-(carboxyamino)imidazole ribonucleotide synthase [uncultured Limosilactobacillus sp.]MRN06467.1 5-(carboxyamino)imidazole ribonucleotide synthase [Lactobacillus sp. 0.1XD8-4]